MTAEVEFLINVKRADGALWQLRTDPLSRRGNALAPNYVAETVRAAFGTLGIVEPTNVVPMARETAG